MPSVTLSLHHFNQSVTACELIIDRASLCDLINTGNPEAIVVVDERYCPLGLIESQTLIAYLLYQQQHPETRNPSSSCLDLSGWLRPIIPLNARMAVSEFLATLTGEALAFVPILVDAQGKLLGRLDTGKLLQFCLGCSILDDPPPQPRISDRNPPPPQRSSSGISGTITAAAAALQSRSGNFIPKSGLVSTNWGSFPR